MTSSFCGKTISMTYGGRTTTATVQDTVRSLFFNKWKIHFILTNGHVSAQDVLGVDLISVQAFFLSLHHSRSASYTANGSL